VNRRRFLGATCAASAGALGLPLGGCIGFHYVTGSVAGGRVVLDRRELDQGRFVLVDVPGFALPLYLYRQEDGTVSAVSTRCMHLGCQVEPVAGHLICPCHGSEYSNEGAVLRGPTRLPLRRYPTAVEDDTILIDVSGGEP
jgi:cytochrome b6-f complex iron-sulfur subunit